VSKRLMDYHFVEHVVHEGIILRYDDPAVISAKIYRLLRVLGPNDVFAVHAVAKAKARAIEDERREKEDDMDHVIGVLSAVLEPMVDWLERHGVPARPLLYDSKKGRP
jgi:hypothetical protein